MAVNPTRRTEGQRIRDLTTERDRLAAELRETKAALSKIKDELFSDKTVVDRMAGIRKVLGANLRHAVSSQSGWYDLIRYQDMSNVSGTGHVAEIAVFSDGTTVLRWNSDTPSTIIYESFDHVTRIHGHGGATEVVPRG